MVDFCSIFQIYLNFVNYTKNVENVIKFGNKIDKKFLEFENENIHSTFASMSKLVCRGSCIGSLTPNVWVCFFYGIQHIIE